ACARQSRLHRQIKERCPPPLRRLHSYREDGGVGRTARTEPWREAKKDCPFLSGQSVGRTEKAVLVITNNVSSLPNVGKIYHFSSPSLWLIRGMKPISSEKELPRCGSGRFASGRCASGR